MGDNIKNKFKIIRAFVANKMKQEPRTRNQETRLKSRKTEEKIFEKIKHLYTCLPPMAGSGLKKTKRNEYLFFFLFKGKFQSVYDIAIFIN